MAHIFFILSYLLTTEAISSDSPMVLQIVHGSTGLPIGNTQVCFSDRVVECVHCDSSGICIVPNTWTEFKQLIITKPDFDTAIVTYAQYSNHDSKPIIINIHPIEKIPSLEKMVIHAKKGSKHHSFSTTPVISFNRNELLTTPGTGSDINRTLALTASTVSMGTYNDNGIIVRGGSLTENAYIVDGIVFDNINHYAGFQFPSGSFGFIDMDMIDRLDFYTGGIPASLPSRSSSVIDLSLKNGSRDGYRFNAKLSLLGAGLSTEGPIFNRKGSFNLGFRYADMRFLGYLTHLHTVPRHCDGTLKLNVNLSDKHTLSLSVIGSYDDFLINWDPWNNYRVGYTDDTLFTSYNFGSHTAAGGLQWNSTVSRWNNSLSISASHRDQHEARDNMLNENVLLSKIDSTANKMYKWVSIQTKELVAENIHVHKLKKRNIRLSDDLSYEINDLLHLASGVSFEQQHYYLKSQWGIQDKHASIFYRIDTTTGLIISESDTTVYFSPPFPYKEYGFFENYLYEGYLQMSLKMGFVKIIPGIRMSYYSLLRKKGISPRIGLNYTCPSLGSLSLSVSMTRQLPTIFEQLLGWDLTRTTISLKHFELQRCFQWNIAWEKIFIDWLSATVETYVKWYDREYPYGNPWHRRIEYYIEDYKKAQRTYIPPSPKGLKKVYGGDVYIKGIIKDQLFYSCIFSMFKTQDQYHYSIPKQDKNIRVKVWHSDAYGLCRKMSLTFGSTIGKKHALSCGLLAMTGRYYNSDKRFEGDKRLYYTEQLDPIFLLSLKYTFTHQFKHCSIETDIDIINILNQKIIIAKVPSKRKLDGILPILSLRLQF